MKHHLFAAIISLTSFSALASQTSPNLADYAGDYPHSLWGTSGDTSGRSRIDMKKTSGRADYNPNVRFDNAIGEQLTLFVAWDDVDAEGKPTRYETDEFRILRDLKGRFYFNSNSEGVSRLMHVAIDQDGHFIARGHYGKHEINFVTPNRIEVKTFGRGCGIAIRNPLTHCDDFCLFRYFEKRPYVLYVFER